MQSGRAFGLFAAAGLALGASFACADQVALRVVALTGQPAPGMGDGVTFAEFSGPRINDQGTIIFWAFTSGGVTTANREGIWAARSGITELALRQGTPAPWYSAPADFVAIPNPALGPDDSIASNGAVSALGIPSPALEAKNTGVFAMHIGDPPEALARKGEQALGLPAGTEWKNQLTVQHVGFSAFGSNAGAGVWNDEGGSVVLAHAAGDPVPGTGRTIMLADGPTLASDGGQVFRALLSGSPLPLEDFAIVSDASGTVETIAATGSVPPGAPDATFNQLDLNPAMNASGKVAFVSSLTAADPFAKSGIWAGTPGSLEMLARAGSPAPGTDGKTFQRFLSPVEINEAGQVAWWATLASGGGAGVWVTEGAETRLVAASGTPVFDRPGTTLRVLERPVLDEQGQVFFMARVQGGSVVPQTNRALMVRDIVGRLVTVVRTGDAVEVAPGDSRTIAEIVFEGSSTSGGYAQVNAHRQAVAHVRFTDGTFAVLAIDVANPAEFNGDGVLDAGDLFAFLDLFVAQDAAADLTQDGQLTIDDFFMFLDAFVKG